MGGTVSGPVLASHGGAMTPDETNFVANPRTFLDSNWVAPPSYYDMNFDMSRFAGTATQVDGFMTINTAANMLAYARLGPAGPNKFAMRCFPRSATGTNTANYIPIWFLPWWANHITEMTIPTSAQATTLGLPDDPSVFFTTALSGCSIFVTGTSLNPTVYHAGCDNNRDFTAHPLHPGGGVDHWRHIFSTAKGNNFAEANKSNYLLQTPDAQAYKNFLANDHKDVFRVEEVKGEGAVFGIRGPAGHWAFFLQENVTVTYYTIRKRRKYGGIVGKKIPIDGEKKVVTRPMCVRQFFPAGGGTAPSWNTTKLL